MKLIYINKVGKDWEGNYMYEFLFSDTTENIDGEDWGEYSADTLKASINNNQYPLTGWEIVSTTYNDKFLTLPRKLLLLCPKIILLLIS